MIALEIHRLVEEGIFGTEIIGSWIYGSAAVTPDLKIKDVDVIVVLRDILVPKRVSCLLSNGIPVSANIIGITGLGEHEPTCNGGFFFSRKLLGPKELVYGNGKECEDLLSLSFAYMIDPWINFIIADSTVPLKSIKKDEILAMLFLLCIHSDYCYLRYFAKWYESDYFEHVWNSSLKNVEKALKIIHIEPERVKTKACLDRIFTNEQKKIQLQYLISSFWQFNFYFRKGNMDFISQYMNSNLEAVKALGETSMIRAHSFLTRTANHRILI